MLPPIPGIPYRATRSFPSLIFCAAVDALLESENQRMMRAKLNKQPAMKYLFFAIFLGGAMAAQAGLSRLQALSMLETADNDRTIGSAGEVSRYQIMPRTWKQYTQSEDYQN